MKILITAQILGEDNLLFDIYTDSDDFTSPLVVGVTKAELLNGYLVDAPTDTVGVKVVSTSGCTDSVELVLTDFYTTTTTVPPVTTTTTTTEAPSDCVLGGGSAVVV